MKWLRIYTTPDGESHFDEVELPTTKRSVHPRCRAVRGLAIRRPASASPASQRACSARRTWCRRERQDDSPHHHSGTHRRFRCHGGDLDAVLGAFL
jgi:hypothetical protein